MKSKHVLLRLAAVMVVIVLTGCSFPTRATTVAPGPGPAVPTADLKPTFDAIAAEAVKTVVAQMTQNAPTAEPATATLAPTETPAATETPLATFTPAPPTLTPTRTLIPWTNTPRATATYAYNCTINETSPAFGDDFPKNAPFDGKWTVTNTSSNTWETGQVDFKYISGAKFQDNVSALDITKNVAKNESYTVVIDMTAPNQVGRYTTNWAFVEGSNILCLVGITIDVK